MIWWIRTYVIAYVKIQKNKIYYPLCQIYSPTVFFFFNRFQKVDQQKINIDTNQFTLVE